MTTWLIRTPVLWSAFAVTVALSAVFAIVMAAYDFAIIDEMFRPDDVRAHVEAMTAEQRRAHAWLTGTVDVLYPFSYAALFAGLALRHLGRLGPWIAGACVVLIASDLLEGFAQVMILNGGMDWLAVKAVATPAKLGLYVPALVMALVAVGMAVRRKLGNRASS